MEEDSSRSTSTTGFLRRGSNISLRKQSNEERSSQYNNKPGNTSKLNPMKARWADNKEKPRYLRDPFHPSGSKAACPSSSKAPIRKHYEVKQRRPFSVQADNAESSSRNEEANCPQSSKKVAVDEDVHSYAQQDDPEDLFSSSTAEEDHPAELDPELSDSSVSSGMSSHAVGPIFRNTALRPKSRKQKDKEEMGQNRPQSASTFVSRPTAPRNATNCVKLSNGADPGVHRRGLKNLGCTSISDVLPSGCSSSSSVNNKRFEVMRKRISDGESSSRSRGLSGQSSLGHSPVMYPGITGPRIRGAEQSASQQTRTIRSIQDSADSVRTRRSSTQHPRLRMPNEREDNLFALRETVTRVRHPDWAHFSLDEAPQQRSSRPFSLELPHEMYSSSRQGSVNQTARSRPSYRPEGTSPQMFHGMLGERDGYRRINMEGIAEVLLALDRIEHDDELSYEQLLVLETNLFLSGLGLHDQHRDMRMDIDNMSYEELLALEERIGSVSTALSDEQLGKCLKRSLYKPTNTELEMNKDAVHDVKCSICQEEYIEGEEVGRMQCEHRYHLSCIEEWLRQKNWCPICKISATPAEKDKGGTCI